jgi:hypothetical protein
MSCLAARTRQLRESGPGQALQPSLLIRDDKVIGAIQLGIWVLSWIGVLFLIGFLIGPTVAIWAPITG